MNLKSGTLQVESSFNNTAVIRKNSQSGKKFENWVLVSWDSSCQGLTFTRKKIGRRPTGTTQVDLTSLDLVNKNSLCYNRIRKNALAYNKESMLNCNIAQRIVNVFYWSLRKFFFFLQKKIFFEIKCNFCEIGFFQNNPKFRTRPNAFSSLLDNKIKNLQRMLYLLTTAV